MNRDMLRRVAQSIRSEERMKYRQGSFFRKLYDMGDGTGPERIECGTIGCVAGHTILVAHGIDRLIQIDNEDHTGIGFVSRAGDALGLDDIQCEALFSGCPTREFLADAFAIDLGQVPTVKNFPNDHLRFGCYSEPAPDVSPQWMAAVLEAIAEHAP